jgi:starch-binding outer membrane protein, SusD/RagB family
MKLKNNILKFGLAAGICVLATTSCQDLTDLQPADAFSETTAFSSAKRAELSVIGMYNAAQSGNYAGNVVRGYPFGAASIEQGDMRGEDMVNQAGFYAITNESTYTPTTANNVWMWNTLFTLINQANITIEGVQKAGSEGLITSEAALAYEGEAKFLRALAMHELLINFSRPYADNKGAGVGIPIRDFAVNSPATVEKAVGTGRGTVAEGYAFILKDLDFAEANLPATRAGNLKIVRAVKGAAIGLKTRVKLHMQDWAGVSAEAAKIVSASAPFTSAIGGYKLTATADGPFKNMFSEEALFSIENNAQDNPGVNGALAAMLGSPALGGRGLVVVSPIVYNLPAFKADDSRRNLMVNNGRSYFTTKYSDYTNRSDNAPILRYAEVLLNYAEAEVRVNGVTSKAISLLNAVRGRATATGVYALADFSTPKDLINAILIERRIEFMAEGKRWGDIHRLALDADYTTGGIPAKMAYGNATFATYNFVTNPALTKNIAAIPYADYKFLWPIPADELARNPTLAAQQNPGY